ncbi:MAG: rod shape-determining protein RodA [Gammaproteobacteria bacterium]|nr:rod shape-determining protein RodA [Gammaproteobacteria bacterium]
MRRVYLNAHEVGRFGWFAHVLRVDFLLLLLLGTVVSLGLVVLWSASGQDPDMMRRQLIRLSLSIFVLMVVARIPPSLMRHFAGYLFWGTALLLVAVLVVGDVGKGAQRWLDLGVIRFQPSEFAKLTVPIAVAAYISKMPTPPSIMRSASAVAIALVPAVLIVKQPDLGTAILVAVSGLAVVFMSGLTWWAIGAVIVALASAAPLYFKYVMHDYQRQRVLTLFEPSSDPLGSSYHIIQSKIAVGSGGLYGKGYLQGTQSQLQFLPERHTDFIFAVIGEELGLIVGILLLMLYLAIIIRCLVIAASSQDSFSRLLAGALTVSFFVYVFVNIGMVIGVLPVVGVPLPLISYGGTSMVSLAIAFGMIMSIANDKQVVQRRD